MEIALRRSVCLRQTDPIGSCQERPLQLALSRFQHLLNSPQFEALFSSVGNAPIYQILHYTDISPASFFFC